MANRSLSALLQECSRIRRSELQQFAENEGQAAFMELVRHPTLVGAGRLTGEWRDSPEQRGRGAGTVLFVEKGGSATPEEENAGVRDMLFSLVVPPERLAGSQRFRVGRTSESEIVIPDYSVSTRHALLQYQDRHYSLEDLNSTNGTSVNGAPLDAKVSLRDGDRIKFGRFQFQLAWPASLFAMLAPQVSRPPVESAPLTLNDLTDALGRFDYLYLKEFCRSNGVDLFKRLIPHPVLVGSSFFPGMQWQRKENVAATIPVFPAGGMAGKIMSFMTGTLFPLVKNPASTVPERSFLIGRAPTADLRMNEATVSALHARIDLQENRFFLSDLESTNGTSINAHTLRPFDAREILIGDKIRIGKNFFVLVSPDTLHANLVR
ncbi:MAG: FHA domain-containing protein [Magnetococcales bacterium]|nr:FHA domain-containing protein [Magnetococcales bacterium]